MRVYPRGWVPGMAATSATPSKGRRRADGGRGESTTEGGRGVALAERIRGHTLATRGGRAIDPRRAETRPAHTTPPIAPRCAPCPRPPAVGAGEGRPPRPPPPQVVQLQTILRARADVPPAHDQMPPLRP